MFLLVDSSHFTNVSIWIVLFIKCIHDICTDARAGVVIDWTNFTVITIISWKRSILRDCIGRCRLVFLLKILVRGLFAILLLSIFCETIIKLWAVGKLLLLLIGGMQISWRLFIYKLCLPILRSSVCWSFFFVIAQLLKFLSIFMTTELYLFGWYVWRFCDVLIRYWVTIRLLFRCTLLLAYIWMWK